MIIKDYDHLNSVWRDNPNRTNFIRVDINTPVENREIVATYFTIHQIDQVAKTINFRKIGNGEIAGGVITASYLFNNYILASYTEKDDVEDVLRLIKNEILISEYGPSYVNLISWDELLEHYQSHSGTRYLYRVHCVDGKKAEPFVFTIESVEHCQEAPIDGSSPYSIQAKVCNAEGDMFNLTLQENQLYGEEKDYRTLIVSVVSNTVSVDQILPSQAKSVSEVIDVEAVEEKVEVKEDPSIKEFNGKLADLLTQVKNLIIERALRDKFGFVPSVDENSVYNIIDSDTTEYWYLSLVDINAEFYGVDDDLLEDAILNRSRTRCPNMDATDLDITLTFVDTDGDVIDRNIDDILALTDFLSGQTYTSKPATPKVTTPTVPKVSDKEKLINATKRATVKTVESTTSSTTSTLDKLKAATKKITLTSELATAELAN